MAVDFPKTLEALKGFFLDFRLNIPLCGVSALAFFFSGRSLGPLSIPSFENVWEPAPKVAFYVFAYSLLVILLDVYVRVTSFAKSRRAINQDRAHKERLICQEVDAVAVALMNLYDYDKWQLSLLADSGYRTILAEPHFRIVPKLIDLGVLLPTRHGADAEHVYVVTDLLLLIKERHPSLFKHSYEPGKGERTFFTKGS